MWFILYFRDQRLLQRPLETALTIEDISTYLYFQVY